MQTQFSQHIDMHCAAANLIWSTLFAQACPSKIKGKTSMRRIEYIL